MTPLDPVRANPRITPATTATSCLITRRASLAVACLAFGCARAAPVDQAAEANRIRALDSAWLSAARDRRFDDMMAVYAKGAQELLPGAPPIRGRDSIAAFFRTLADRLPRFVHTFEPLSIRVAESGDLAVVTGTFRFLPDSLDPTVDDVGKFVGVWTREAGTWRLLLDIANSDRPPR